MKNKKIYVIGGANHYANWIKNATLVNDAQQADIIMFTGGADVNPRIYGQNIGKYTNINVTRDKLEESYYRIFGNKFKIGVCRGSQFLNVMNGGSLIQHVNGHAINQKHVIETNDNKTFNVTSTHHQMCIPSQRRGFELIAWANKLSTCYLDGDNREIKLPDNYKEFEIGYYQDSKSLLIQSHPEMMNDQDFFNYLNNLIDTKMNEKPSRVSSFDKVFGGIDPIPFELEEQLIEDEEREEDEELNF